MSDEPQPPYGSDQTTGTANEATDKGAVLEKVVELALTGDKEAAIQLYMSNLTRTRAEAEIFVEGF